MKLVERPPRTAVCRICDRRRARAFLQRDIYGDEWECRSAKDCDAAVEGKRP